MNLKNFYTSLVVSCAVAGATLLSGAGQATAQEPLSQTAEAVATAQPPPPCGQSTKEYRGPGGNLMEIAYFWRNCRNVGDYVNIDISLWPDEQRCVGAGKTEYVGSSTVGGPPAGNVRGVRLIGDC